MTYHPLGALPQLTLPGGMKVSDISASRPSASAADRLREEQANRRIAEGTRALQSQPIAVPPECATLRAPSMDMWETIEPPVHIMPNTGVMMFSVKVPLQRFNSRFPKSEPEVRTRALLQYVNGIKRRMRPAIPRWSFDNDGWRKYVGNRLAASRLVSGAMVAPPDGDTMWKLDWNHTGPVAKEARHITSINSMPDQLYQKLIDWQRNAPTAKGLTWLRAVQPGTSGVLPDEGIVWWTVQVLRNPSAENPSPPGGARGRALLSQVPTPFTSGDLTRWANAVAESEMRAQSLGSGAVVIPAWIPGVRVAEISQRPTYWSNKNWRNTTLREDWIARDNRLMRLAGYAPMSPSQSSIPSPLAIETATIPESVARTIPTGGFKVLGQKSSDPRSQEATTAYNVGRGNRMIVERHRMSQSDGWASYEPSFVNRMHDISIVMGDALGDLFLPFFAHALIGLKTDKSLRDKHSAWLYRIDEWIDIQQLVTNSSAIAERALSIGESARDIMNDDPQQAMTLVNGAIAALETAISRLQSLVSKFQSQGFQEANIPAALERDSETSITALRAGLTNALHSLQRNTRPGATENQRTRMRCVLYKKANYEGRVWPAKFHALIPIALDAVSAARASIPHVQSAIATYTAALNRLRFIQSQIPLPWYLKKVAGLPAWSWGAIGVTGFLGGAVALRKRRKKRLAAKGIKKNAVRRTSR